MSWLGRLFRRERLERELDKELQFHVEERAAELRRNGASSEEARRRALAEFGGVEPIKEQARDARGTQWISDIGQDVRYALRMLRSNKGFTFAAVLSLALGIGANASVFRVINDLILRPLAVEQPNQLFILESSATGISLFSHPAYLDLAAAAPAARLAVMTRPSNMQVTIDGSAELGSTTLVSRSFFDVLGIAPQEGRVFSAAEEQAAAPVAVISDGYWTRQFARRPVAIGSTILVNNAPHTIIGVAPPTFTGVNVGSPADIWLPVTAQHGVHYQSNSSSKNGRDDEPWVPQREISWLAIMGRYPASGAGSIPAALSSRYTQLVAESAKAIENPDRRERALTDHLVIRSGARGFSDTRERATPALTVLMGMVGLVLLVACANLANLLLARGAARAREFSLRLSIGARRGRLIRQLLTESLTLAAIGGAAGLALAFWGAAALTKLMAQGRAPSDLGGSMDWRVTTFGLGVTLITGLAFGLLPALRLSRPEMVDAMKSGGRVVGTGRRGRLPLVKSLVAVQVAVSLLLLAGAMLFFQTFRNYVKVDAGYDRDHVVSARFDTRLAGFTQDELPGLYARLLDASARIPGVRSATLGQVGPSTGSATMSTLVIDGYTPGPTEDVIANEEYVGPGYFSTLGMHLLAGRDFAPSDDATSRHVVIINETMAKRFFDKKNPVGLGLGYDVASENEIIGIVADARANGLRRDVPPLMYSPLAQHPDGYARNLYVRADGAIAPVTASLRDAIKRVAPGLAIREIVTLGELTERTVASERTVSDLTALFGLLGVAVASLGLYGTIAYSVARRTNEIGVRLALGASPSGVRWMVVQETLWLVAAGVVAGVLLMLPLSRLLESVLFGVTGHDPRTLLLASIAVMAVGALAGLIPAFRASRVNPTSALRAD
jgi:predicted permease